MRGPALLLLLAALPAAVASCSESDEVTALDLVVDPRAIIDQIDIRSVTLDGQLVTLAAHLLPRQPTRLQQGDVLRLLFDDDKGGSDVVVTAVGLDQGAAVTPAAIAMGTLQTKHPVRATLVLGSGGTGGNGGAGGGGNAGSGGTAGGGGSTASGGAAGTGGVAGGGGAGRGGTTGTAGAGGTGGASGSGGVTGTAGRGGTGGGGTGGGGRGGSTAGTGGTTGAAGRGGTGGTTGAAGRGGTGGGIGGTGTAGRGGTGGGTGGTGGAPRCMVVPAPASAVAAEIPLSVLGNMTECGYPVMVGGNVMYAAINGSRFALIRDLEFGQSAACGRCIEVTSSDVSRATVVTVVGSCNAIPGVPCGANGGVILSPQAYGAVSTGATQFPVTWRYVACQSQGPVYARLDPTFSGVIILNHVYGIAKVEIQDLAGAWIMLARSPSNFWGAAGITLAGRAIRVTDINGGVVTGNLQGSNADQPLAAQLPMCLP